MRDYGVISPKFWIGGTGKLLRGNQEAQLVAVYLMTSPHANMIGIFHCPLYYIAQETGLTAEGASKGLRSLVDVGFCEVDDETEEVFVLRMAAYQIGEQLEQKDNRCKGVSRELEKVMSDGLRSAFRALYSVAFHLPEFPAVAPKAEAPPKPLRSQEQDQEQDQDSLAPIGACPPAANDVPKRYEVPDCPHVQVVALYHEHCPTLPRCEVLNDARRGMLRQRWREVCTTEKYDAPQALEWWADFFRFVSESNFLTGRAKPRPGGEPFLADFEWLIGPKNFAKVIERRYHRKAA